MTPIYDITVMLAGRSIGELEWPQVPVIGDEMEFPDLPDRRFRVLNRLWLEENVVVLSVGEVEA